MYDDGHMTVIKWAQYNYTLYYLFMLPSKCLFYLLYLLCHCVLCRVWLACLCCFIYTPMHCSVRINVLCSQALPLFSDTVNSTDCTRNFAAHILISNSHRFLRKSSLVAARFVMWPTNEWWSYRHIYR